MAPPRILVALALTALMAVSSGCCGGRAPTALAADLDAYDAAPLAAPVPHKKK
jgi:hypothetical protein